MIKILFLINTLGGGGAERVLINLVNHMDTKKFDISVETMFGEGCNRKNLTEKAHFISKRGYKFPGLSYALRFIPAKLLYEYYIGKEKYDIIVAYMHGAPTKVISGCTDPRIKTVTWLHHGNPQTGSFFKFWMTEKHAISAYAKLDAIVGVSQSTTHAFEEYTGIKERCITLYNTNDLNRVYLLSKEEVELNYKKPLICTVGNLTNPKGYDRLIKVVDRLCEKRFTVLIIGDGPERDKLRKLVSKHGLDDKIKMLGFQDNPYKYMAKSDLFVSSSREEGLATVLVEALALGLPVISTEVSGAKEVLGENNEYGLVVENSEEGIYQGLMTYLDAPKVFNRYRQNGINRAKLFNVKNTVERTDAFFESLVANR